MSPPSDQPNCSKVGETGSKRSGGRLQEAWGGEGGPGPRVGGAGELQYQQERARARAPGLAIAVRRGGRWLWKSS